MHAHPFERSFTRIWVRFALSVGAAVVLLAACGVQQAPSITPPVRAQGLSGGDLLYVSTAYEAFTYTYPLLQSAGTINGDVGNGGLCSDSAGNVFTGAVNASGLSSTIYEYAHGGTTPIASLSDPGLVASCAVDPNTDDLAVVNFEDYSNPYYDDLGDIAVYRGTNGTPTMYYSPTIGWLRFCGYDNNDNLYVTGQTAGQRDMWELAVLAKASTLVTQVNVNKNLYGDEDVFYPSVQWDGKYMTVSSIPQNQNLHRSRTFVAVYRLRIKGTTATVAGTTKLKTNGTSLHMGQIVIQGQSLIAPYLAKGQKVGVWQYPRGGAPKSVVEPPLKGSNRLWGLTISVGSTR